MKSILLTTAILLIFWTGIAPGANVVVTKPISAYGAAHATSACKRGLKACTAPQAVKGPLGTTGTPFENLTISGPNELLPTFPGEYLLAWTGGQPPFTAILATQACPTGLNDCVADGATFYGTTEFLSSRQWNLGTSISDARITTMVGTVIDATGAIITSSTKHVRVGTEGRYHVSNYSYVSFSGSGCFDRRRFSPVTVDPDNPDDDLFDPDAAFIRIVDETNPPTFAWDVINQGGSDSFVATLEVRAGFGNTLYGLEDATVPQTGLVQPLTYGDYDQPGTLPYLDPPIPAPPLPIGERMTAELLSFDGGCAPSRPSMAFSLNPPNEGDPVILQGPAEAIETAEPDPAFAEILARRRQIRLQPAEGAIAACVNEALTFRIIAFIAAGGRSNQVLGLVEEVTFEIVTNTEVRDKLRAHCAATAAPRKDNIGDDAAQTKTVATTPDFDLEVNSGSGRVTLPDPTTVSEIRTAHASVIVTGGALTLDIAQTKDSRRSTIGSPDTEIVVTPNNPALTETSVPSGFFVTLSDTAVSEPTEFALFADGFE